MKMNYMNALYATEMRDIYDVTEMHRISFVRSFVS